MTHNRTNSLFVTGASGQLGRRVVDILLEQKIPVAAGTRTPSTLKDPARKGLHVVPTDFDDLGTLDRAFAGVDRLLIISTPSDDGSRRRQYKNVVDVAKKAGVKHIVFTSFVTAPVRALRTPFWDDYNFAEDLIAESGISFTILRNNLYLELLPMVATGIQSGIWKHAFSEYGSPVQGGIAFVGREDCANVAASILSSNSIKNAVWTISGPDTVTPDQVVAYVSEATGKPYKAEAVSVDRLYKVFKEAGIPEEHTGNLVMFHSHAAASFMSAVTPDVRNITGKIPISAREWIFANKAAFCPL